MSFPLGIPKRKLDKKCPNHHVIRRMKIKKKKFLEPSQEEKAFVYQQALELSPLLTQGGGPIAIILKKKQENEESRYLVSFILVPDSLNIKIKQEGTNLFDVCIRAKNQAKKTIGLLANRASSPHRKIQIEHFKKFPYHQ